MTTDRVPQLPEGRTFKGCLVGLGCAGLIAIGSWVAVVLAALRILGVI